MNATQAKASRQQAMSANFQLLYGRGYISKSYLTAQMGIDWAVDFHRNFPLTLFGRHAPDLHGGARRFHRQLVSWTRDLKPLGHRWARDGRRVFCSRCQYTMGLVACAKGGRASHRLRQTYHSIVWRLGSCDQRVVFAVMES